MHAGRSVATASHLVEYGVLGGEHPGVPGAVDAGWIPVLATEVDVLGKQLGGARPKASSRRFKRWPQRWLALAIRSVYRHASGWAYDLGPLSRVHRGLGGDLGDDRSCDCIERHTNDLKMVTSKAS